MEDGAGTNAAAGIAIRIPDRIVLVRFILLRGGVGGRERGKREEEEREKKRGEKRRGRRHHYLSCYLSFKIKNNKL